MLRYFTLALCLLAGGSLFGQIIKKTVAIAPVSYSRQTSNEADAIRLYNYILNSMHQSQRLNIVDRFQGQDEIVKEKTLNKGVDFVEGTVAAQGKQVGADYVLVTHINAANAVTLRDKEEKILGYVGNLSLFCRVLSVETGEVIASQIITPDGNEDLDMNNVLIATGEELFKTVGGPFKPSFSNSKEAAVQKSLSDVEPHIRKFINDIFPLEMRIADIQEVQHRKKTVTEVFLLGGKSLGLKDNDMLDIMEIVERKIGPKTYIDNVNVGRLKVDRISEDLVTCKIIKESKIVMEAFAENPESLKVIYIPKTGVFQR